jgi:hypothetical protein
LIEENNHGLLMIVDRGEQPWVTAMVVLLYQLSSVTHGCSPLSTIISNPWLFSSINYHGLLMIVDRGEQPWVTDDS